MWLQSKRQFQPKPRERGVAGEGMVDQVMAPLVAPTQRAATRTHTQQQERTATIYRASNNPTSRLLMLCPSPSTSTSLTASYFSHCGWQIFTAQTRKRGSRHWKIYSYFIASGNIFSTSLQTFLGSVFHRVWVKLEGKGGAKCHTEVKTSLNFNRHRRWGNNKNIFGVQFFSLQAAVNWQQLPLPFPYTQHSPPCSTPNRTLSIWHKCEKCEKQMEKFWRRRQKNKNTLRLVNIDSVNMI